MIPEREKRIITAMMILAPRVAIGLLLLVIVIALIVVL